MASPRSRAMCRRRLALARSKMKRSASAPMPKAPRTAASRGAMPRAAALARTRRRAALRCAARRPRGSLLMRSAIRSALRFRVACARQATPLAVESDGPPAPPRRYPARPPRRHPAQSIGCPAYGSPRRSHDHDSSPSRDGATWHASPASPTTSPGSFDRPVSRRAASLLPGLLAAPRKYARRACSDPPSWRTTLDVAKAPTICGGRTSSMIAIDAASIGPCVRTIVSAAVRSAPAGRRGGDFGAAGGGAGGCTRASAAHQAGRVRGGQLRARHSSSARR